MKYLPLLLCLATVACGDVHTSWQDVVAPSTPKPTPGVQTRMVVLAASRPDQQLDVSAQVLDGLGVGIAGIDVAFSITGGTVTPPLVKTDGTGTAKTIALASGSATITATTGALTEKVTTIGGAIPLAVNLTTGTVTIGTPTPFSASTTGTAIGGPFAYLFSYGDGTSDTSAGSSITHLYSKSGTYSASVKVTDGSGRSVMGFVGAQVNDPPVVPPPAPAPAAALAIALTCTPQAHGTPTPCNVNATYGGTQLSATAITRVDWDWGDGTTTANGGVVATRTYVNAGSYVVFATVTATTTDGSKTAIASKAITVP